MAKESECIVHAKQLAEIHQAVKTIVPMVEEMHKSLYVGNGKDSIMTTMRLHGKDIKELKCGKKSAGARTWDFAKIVVAAAIALIARWLLTKGGK